MPIRATRRLLLISFGGIGEFRDLLQQFGHLPEVKPFGLPFTDITKPQTGQDVFFVPLKSP